MPQHRADIVLKLVLRVNRILVASNIAAFVKVARAGFVRSGAGPGRPG
jgi:hypothetical protein